MHVKPPTQSTPDQRTSSCCHHYPYFSSLRVTETNVLGILISVGERLADPLHDLLEENCSTGWKEPDTLQPPLPCPALYSPVQEQQAHPYHHPKSTRPRDWGGRSLHRLHPSHPVYRRAGSASHQPVRGDSGLAPPGWQVAQCPLSLLRGPCRTAAVSSATGAPGRGGAVGRGWDRWGPRRKRMLGGGTWADT